VIRAVHQIVDANLRVAMRCYGNLGGAAEIREISGVSVASSGVDFAVFNSAMLLAAPETGGLAKAISVARVHFAARGLGWTFWLCEDLLPPDDRYRAREIFRTFGMTPVAQPPGMYTDRIGPPVRGTLEVECRRVSNSSVRGDFADLSAAIFSLPPRIASQIYASDRLWQPPMTGWVAYLNGKPVAIVSIVIGGGSAGVYSLGTLSEYRGRGVAESLLRHALEAARQEEGIEATVLQTTSQGMRLYLRMGYRVVANFSVYIQEGCRLR
jgi:GNAT superfamily N-acetyltransferase